MPEIAVKRRIREWKRRVVTTYTDKGYSVSTYESGPFHLSICKGRDETRVRFAFNYVSDDEVLAVSRAATPDRCAREIWQISEDGRTIVIGRISRIASTGNTPA